MSKTISSYFDENDIKNFIENFDENLDSKTKIDDLIVKRNLKQIYKREFDFDGKTCFYCRTANSHEILEDYSIDEKLKNKYCLFNYQFAIDSNSFSLFLDKIFSSKFSNLRKISLCNCSLEFENNGDNFFNELKYICEISLENNQISSLPNSLFKSNNISSLRINNPIKSLPDLKVFQSMKNLQNLELSETDFLKNKQNFNDAKIILSGNLKQLKIKYLQLDFLPFDFDYDSQLISLEIPGVPWLDIDYFERTNTFITLKTLTEFYDKHFTQEQIIKLFRHFDHDSNGYLTKEEAMKFNAFIFKRFSRLGDNTNELSSDSKLQSGIPEDIFKLSFIKYLDLSYQAIRLIPEEIANLEHLNVLILKDCILLSSVSPKLSLLPITSLNLENCFSLKTPPPEIVKRGMSSALSYLKRLCSGSVLCKKTKLMFVCIYL